MSQQIPQSRCDLHPSNSRSEWLAVLDFGVPERVVPASRTASQQRAGRRSVFAPLP